MAEDVIGLVLHWTDSTTVQKTLYLILGVAHCCVSYSLELEWQRCFARSGECRLLQSLGLIFKSDWRLQQLKTKESRALTISLVFCGLSQLENPATPEM